jgi:GNAT superfamily N-acetyltransferase
MSPTSTPTLRPSTLADLETHVAHRVAMFRDMEMGTEEGRKRMAEAFRHQLRGWFVTGQCRGLVVEDHGKAVASVLMLLKDTLPTPVTPLSVRGYLFNVYTEPSHRRRGLAARLTDAALDLARELGIEIMELHASLEAEGMYQRMGFVPTSEMRLVMSAGIKTPKQWKHRR